MASTLTTNIYLDFLVQCDVRICIGEAMKLFLIHWCEYFLIDGRKTYAFSGKYTIEILRIQRMFLLKKRRKEILMYAYREINGYTYHLWLERRLNLPLFELVPVNGSKEYMICYITSWTILWPDTFRIVLLQQLKKIGLIRLNVFSFYKYRDWLTPLSMPVASADM